MLTFVNSKTRNLFPLPKINASIKTLFLAYKYHRAQNKEIVHLINRLHLPFVSFSVLPFFCFFPLLILILEFSLSGNINVLN